MTAQRARITEGGRLVIPAELRRALGLQPGTVVVLEAEDGALRVRTLAQSIARAQAIAAQYITPGTSLVDELIADRRAEAARE